MTGSFDPSAVHRAAVSAFRKRRRVLVAYSGGVDSGLVAKLAHDALGANALAVIANAESVPRRDLEEAIEEAVGIGIPLRVVPVSELASEGYRENSPMRCYFCRQELAGALRDIADRDGFAAIADGVHLDDLGDIRPGIRAMDEGGFWHPLVELGLTKSRVRSMARSLGLPFHDKPANACLSSRIRVGEPITVGKLRQVERAESVLRDLGFRLVRVRHSDGSATVEVGREEVPRLLDDAIAKTVADRLRAVGYREVTLDPRGYHDGAAPS